MPHNSIPGYGEHHTTIAAGTPTAIAAKRAGLTPEAYAAQHGHADVRDVAQPGAAQRTGDSRRAGSHALGASERTERGTGLLRSGPGLKWYEDERVGLAVSGAAIVGLMIAAWFLHRDDEESDPRLDQD